MSEDHGPVGLEHVRLEDSWVLDVVLTPRAARLELDVVLLEGHPAHTRPAPGRRYCYRRGVLRFTGVTSSAWEHPHGPTAGDVPGDVSDGREWGHVETWTVEGRTHCLAGGWGRLELVAEPPLLVLAADAAADPGLATALREEASLPRAARSTGASDGVLEAAIVIVERGAVTEREAATLRHVISDSWPPAAPLSERLLAWVTRARS